MCGYEHCGNDHLRLANVAPVTVTDTPTSSSCPLHCGQQLSAALRMTARGSVCVCDSDWNATSKLEGVRGRGSVVLELAEKDEGLFDLFD